MHDVGAYAQHQITRTYTGSASGASDTGSGGSWLFLARAHAKAGSLSCHLQASGLVLQQKQRQHFKSRTSQRCVQVRMLSRKNRQKQRCMMSELMPSIRLPARTQAQRLEPVIPVVVEAGCFSLAPMRKLGLSPAISRHLGLSSNKNKDST